MMKFIIEFYWKKWKRVVKYQGFLSDFIEKRIDKMVFISFHEEILLTEISEDCGT